MTNSEREIRAQDTPLKQLLMQKFYVDDFQREYRWGKPHIESFIEDLTSAFLISYKESHNPEEVANYKSYYVGPMVFSTAGGTRSIIDGQQRITSMTLLLIYLNNLQEGVEDKEYIENLIFSKKHGQKTFNITDSSRHACLQSLFDNGEYRIQEGDDESIINMVNRYDDIDEIFPQNLKENALPYFIDWLVEKVIVVEIEAYSAQSAYTIFESMNDRGLKLNSTELLKGYVLSNIENREHKDEINGIWRSTIQELRKLQRHRKDADVTFFEAWFKSKYARSEKADEDYSRHADFEKIANQFHRWFKDSHNSLIKLNSSNSFHKYFKEDFPFFASQYMRFREGVTSYDKRMPHLIYLRGLGFAESLSEPLLLAPINISDDEMTICRKFDLTARYMETLAVRRTIHGWSYAQSGIKSMMYNTIGKIRNKDIDQLASILISEIMQMDKGFGWDAASTFSLGHRKKDNKFVKHLLSRITGYVDELLGNTNNYASYHYPSGRSFEIEHILGNNFLEEDGVFDDENDFSIWRNKIGALLLIPNGTNQSFGSDKYEDKLKFYIRENAYAQTLHHDFYSKNPNFIKPEKINSLGFEKHPKFEKEEIKARSELVQRICEQLWSTDYFTS